MKYRAWIGQAVSALSDGTGSRRKDGLKKRKNQPRAKEREGAPAEEPRLPIAEQFSSDNWKLRLERPDRSIIEDRRAVPIPIPSKAIHKQDDVEWIISGSTSSDSFSMRADSQASTCSDSTVTLSTITEPSDETISGEDAEHDEPCTSLANSAAIKGSFRGTPTKSQLPIRPKLQQRTKSYSSTIFERSPTAPITIIVTTPDSDPPMPRHTSPSSSCHSRRLPDPYSPRSSGPSMSKSKSYLAERPARSFSTPSIPSLVSSQRLLPTSSSTLSLPSTSPSKFPDPTRLMPPSEQAIDINRLRRAQEFREIRKFIINFLNSKGETFPSRLRQRIMTGYGIEWKDLDPETVRRFARADSMSETDEGVALDGVGIEDGKGKEMSNAENLRILSMAFQSQIPVVTPHPEEAYVRATPGRLPKDRTRTLLEEREMRLLGRTLSTSDLPLRQSMSRNHSPEYGALKASVSVPDLSYRRPLTHDIASLPRTVSSRTGGGQTEKVHFVVGDRKQLGIVEQQTRIKRQSIISGAFGAVREALGGSAGKERERRRMLGERF